MLRKIIKIDEDKCNGCSICASACHEGAIRIIDGKAKLVSESYCDGLGACLPECPTGALTLEEREAAAFDEAAVKQAKEKASPEKLACGCPGTHAKEISRQMAEETPRSAPAVSRLGQWPVQIKLVPVNAPYFENANLLIAADCTAYAYANMHEDFMRNRITLIGCPKLDREDYAEKLSQILLGHEIKSLTVVRMEVPCCGGIVDAVRRALAVSGKVIPWRVVTVSADGQILED